MANQNTTPWTPALVERLNAMHANGDSFGVIGEELGISRSMVAGKCRRLGLRFAATARRRSLAPSAKAPRTPHCVKRRVVEPPVISLALSLGELRRGQCKYPTGDRGNFTFCGHAADRSYCSYHSGLVYRRAA